MRLGFWILCAALIGGWMSVGPQTSGHAAQQVPIPTAPSLQFASTLHHDAPQRPRGPIHPRFAQFVGTANDGKGAASPLPVPPIPGNWRLTLNENFDGPLNPKVWSDRELWNDAVLGASLFEPENIAVRNGELIITTKRKQTKIARGDVIPFSSGLVQSFGRFTQRYGYFEARMRLPVAKGLWPAFWLMPDRGIADLDRWWLAGRRTTSVQTGELNGFTGKGMEIDIMEHLTIWGPNKFHAAAHWDEYGEQHKKQEQSSTVPPSPDGWRLFGLHWRPNLLVWYVDNKEVYRIENERVADVPMYILLNTTVGGWDNNYPDPDTKLPAETKVDWVRVWAEG